ncbi:MAG: gamma-glutamylcyclotransferase [Pseudomonadota bacterium]
MREPSNDNRTGLLSEDIDLQDASWLRNEMDKRNIIALSPDDCEQNRLEILKNHDPAKDLWIFGYGSLMGDAGADVAETLPALVTGWRRSFCIDMLFGRGSPRKPGLMMALDKGGECRGIAHRILAKDIESQTKILWQNEMALRTYRPAWIEVTIDNKPQEALAFVIDQETHLYAGSLSPAIQARRIATAEGPLGLNRDDLYNCAAELKRREISDSYIEDLTARTRALAQDKD